jgi:hypothetical protein
VFVLASVPSQQTLVVDQATGPYTTIGAAVAAASPGDRIEVHPGNYQGFTVSIGVEIVAPLGNVPLTLPLGTSVAISVGNAANQFVLLGIDTAHDLIALPVIEMPFVLSTAASLYAVAPPSPTSPTSFSLFVPPAPWLANVFVYWQAVTVANDGTIQFSNGGYGRIQ